MGVFTLLCADNDSLTLSATTLPAWLTFDAATGVLSGTPANTDVGDHSVVLSVTDGTAPAVTQSFTISVTAIVVANTAPVISSSSLDSATEEMAYSYTLSASDADGDLIVNVTNGINFEGTEAQQSSWTAFENGTDSPALEFVAHPPRKNGNEY